VNEAWDDAVAQPPDPRVIPPWYPVADPAPGYPGGSARHAGRPGDDPGEFVRSRPEPDEADDLVIRPFLLTGGRTRPAQEGLRVESLIQARADALRPDLRFEARQIVELCRGPVSLAELAAALRLPLGVARVLVSDLVADGLIALVQREELSVQMIERIRDRVRAL
jgi:Protein of unknown function (DUF742)